MENKIHLEIVSPEGVIYQDDINEITLPTTEGEITILPGHAPLLARLSSGEARIIKGKEEIMLAILGGFLEVNGSSINIASDYAVRSEKIELAKAEEAKKRAEKLLEEKHENLDFKLIEKDLQRSILELKIGERVKKKNR